MFNRYDLTLMKDALVKQYVKECKDREDQGLSKEIIKAQLGGLFALLVKINVELIKTQP